MSKIKSFFLREAFQPSFISIFLSPVYLIRKGIYNALKSRAENYEGRILDFGCGIKPYESLFTNASEYIGVDYDLGEQSPENSKVDFFYDGKTLPFSDNSFDNIVCFEVIEHIFNPEEIIPELYRVLKKDGKAIFTFPFAWPEHSQPYDYARYSSFSSKFIFEKFNFKVIDYQKTGNFIQVIFQFIICYFLYLIPTKNTKIQQIIMIPFSFIFNFLGLLFSFILPTQKDLYFNNVIVVQK
jgi:SAM-dependent methyltransferase